MHLREIVAIVLALVLNIGTITAMWWQLDSKIETRIGRLEALLTNNLIVLNRDLGELKGASHSHNP